MKPRAWLVAVATLTVPAAAGAQTLMPRVGAGASYESYRFSAADDIGFESISLLVLPAAARVAITPSVALDVSSAWASGTLVRADGSESMISGPTDTELRLEVGLGRGLLNLTAIALLPSGSESLSSEEADVAGAIAADVLPFAISNWGTGGGFGVSTAIARPIGSFAAGLSVGYVVAREFEPLEDEASRYRPGNQLHIRAALDRTFGDAGKAAVVVTVQRFGGDEIDGSNLFQTGDRYQAVGSYAFAAGATGNGIVYLGWLHRDASEFTQEDRLMPAQDLAFGGAGLEMPAGRVLLKPSVDLRLLRRGDGAGQGYTAGIGGTAEVPAGMFTLLPTLRGRFGNATLSDDVESGFTGFEVGLTLRF